MGFLDNLGKTISHGVDRAKFEAERLQRTTRLKSEISDLQTRLDTNLRQLGERALELHRQGALQAPEIGSLVAMLDQLQGQMSAKQAELEQAQKESFEQAAGRAQQSSAAQHEQATDLIACPTCGTSVPADAAFCGNCGANLQA